MRTTSVDRTFSEILSVRSIVANSDSGSDLANFDAIAAKVMVISSASYFEKCITQLILKFSSDVGAHELVVLFISNQALSRKYHQLFNWDSNNINGFFGLFGKEAKRHLEEQAKIDEMTSSISDFIFVSRQRNELVHENFSGYSLSFTTEEAEKKNQSAMRFIDWLSDTLFRFARSTGTSNSDQQS